MSAMALQSALRQGAHALRLDLADAQVAQLLGYLDLLQKWNKVYNLTAVRSAADMLTQHLLDSLAVVGPLRRQTRQQPFRLLDVGTGAGLPGVVIAICCPECRVDCVDAVAKKAAFIQQVALSLQLPRLQGLHDRVERLDGPYQVISARAFSSLADLVALSTAALDQNGVWLAMKGKIPDAEMACLPPGVQVFHVEPLQVPGLDADRCLVWLQRTPECRRA